MKKILYISCLILIFVACKSEKHEDLNKNIHIDASQVDTLATVNMLNNYKTKINNIKTNLNSSEEDIYKSAEGGAIKKFYRKADTLKKEIVYYGETGKKLIEVYLQENTPVLVKTVKFIYEKPIYVEKRTKIKKRVTNTYYFDNKLNLIYWIQDGKVMPSSIYSKKGKIIVEAIFM